MQGVRRAAAYFAILAIVLRGLLPTGWMPNPEGVSKTALIICDMDDAGMAKMDMSQMSGMPGMDMSGKDQAPAHKQADDSHSQTCPFAAAPHFATPSVAAILFLPALAAGFARTGGSERVGFNATTYAPQSPRAPPSLA